MCKFEEIAQVVSQKELASGIFDLTIRTAEIAKHAKAGQFLSVYCADKTKLLPRPISLCGIDREAGTLRLVYRVTGEGTGTEEFSRLAAGDSIRVLGPLGNGFSILPGKKAFLVGGGIGVPPMLQLAKEMGQTEFEIVMGYRNADTFLLDEFKEQGNVLVATEDGSVGTKGNVLDAIRANGAQADVIYACGPMPMLRALKQYANEQQMECFISMEERMACGIGACLACVCKSKEVDAHSNVKNKRICKEGPVFDAKEVEL
jgi:dihydroorotate dehydrogenase electron transfer subunit